jgi:hypothetical protein
MECTMSYKLEDLFSEKSIVVEKKINEDFMNIIKSLGSLATNAIRGLFAKREAKQVDKVINLLEKLRKFGIKEAFGTKINQAIKDLQRYKYSLTNEEEPDNLTTLLKKWQREGTLTKQQKSRRSRRRRTKTIRTESSFKLKDIFLESPEDNPVQNDPEKEYNDDDVDSVSDKETVMQKAVDSDSGLSDEEVLAGLRDDVVHYGEYDPAIGEEQ